MRDAGGSKRWPLPPGVTGRAVFSGDGEYRYQLRREWNVTGRIAAFVGLNPSTAEGDVDDPTVRKCWRWAHAWGYGSLVMLNAFAYRATDPSMLGTVDDPFGPDNEAHLRAVAAEAQLIVAAWGNSKYVKVFGMEERLTAMLTSGKTGVIHCLGTCRDGSPRHPLYLPNASEVSIWRMREAAAAA
jgi:hypothetical protein